MKTKIHSMLILFFAFATTKTFAQIPNSGFENWTTVGNYENANGWGTPNDACSGPFYRITKSTDIPIAVGSYSIRMENNTSLLPSFCGYGFEQTQQGTNGTTQFPITGHPTSLTGYYKFAPLNGDTMEILILLYNAGVQQSVGSFSTSIAAPNWTTFNIPFTTYTTADSASILLSALYLAPTGTHVPHGNSVLYVDNLNFDTLLTTGISEVSETNNISVYPNPFSTQTTLKSNENLRNATLTIYNSFGQQVKQLKNISGQSITLQRDNLPSGLYFIRLMQDNKTFATDKLIITD